MRIICSFLLLASLSFGQDAPAASTTAPGCGPIDIHFQVKADQNRHPTIQPDAGKAVLYFLQDDAEYLTRPRPTTRMGIDGEWVGATKSNSYFYVLIAPGEHHLCASWQSSGGAITPKDTAAAHFTADPGGVYFFRARDFWARDIGTAHVELLPLDSDEAPLLVGKFSFSTSTPKKSSAPSE
ncbi:MAG: hypothetical protein ABSD39_04865 [Terriglobales bacterium]|jgi:hypothetical protein